MTNRTFLPWIAICAACTVIGLVSGYYGGSGRPAAAADGAKDDASAHAHNEPTFAPETLKNMGIRIAPAILSSFSICTDVPADVMSGPRARQDVFAPIAGRVKTLVAIFGSVIERGDVVATVVRDPLPRAELMLTKHFLEPASETLHETMTAYRKAVVSREIYEMERKRLAAFSSGAGDPVIPKQRLIKVEYDLKRADRELASLRHELERHGLTDQQITSVERGRFPAIDVNNWIGALKHNGFWTPLAQRIYGALPKALRTVPWTVATIGEIVAGGFDADGVATWLEATPAAGRHFLEIGGLLQRGHSLADLKNRFGLGAFDPEVAIRAPADARDWDVVALLVKPGQRVEAGTSVVTLENPRRAYLRVHPTGGEIEAIARAIEGRAKVTARPLVPGSGPALSGLAIEKLAHEPGGRVLAYVPIENTTLSTVRRPDGSAFRSWRLGAGLRYLVHVPKRSLSSVYVFPASALTEIGPDKVVFLKSGDTFKPIQVEVLHQDHEVVVLPANSAIFPENPIVTHGAFALGLALKAADAGGGGQGGHGHAH